MTTAPFWLTCVPLRETEITILNIPPPIAFREGDGEGGDVSVSQFWDLDIYLALSGHNYFIFMQLLA